jgi:hypothetical protein
MTIQEQLAPVKEDFFSILDKAPWEAYAVRQAVVEGKIDGSTYGKSECCCIKGIIARNMGMEILSFSTGQKFSATYGIDLEVLGNDSPLEKYIRFIKPGHAPENNKKCQQLLDWLDEFITQEEAKQAAQVTASVQAGLDEALASAGELPAADQAKLALAQV